MGRWGGPCEWQQSFILPPLRLPVIRTSGARALPEPLAGGVGKNDTKVAD